MMDLATIHALSAEAAAEAAAERRVPFLYWPQDTVQAPFPFPNLGDYRPEGWTLIDTLFCDKSGWGADDEPALSVPQLIQRIEALNAEHHFNLGYAIVEEGEFQCVIGVFTKEAH